MLGIRLDSELLNIFWHSWFYSPLIDGDFTLQFDGATSAFLKIHMRCVGGMMTYDKESKGNDNRYFLYLLPTKHDDRDP